MSGRAERPNKRLRRLSSEYDDSEGTDDWIPLKEPPNDAQGGQSMGDISRTTISRIRRSANGPGVPTPVADSPPVMDEVPQKPIRLTVKMPASNIQEPSSGGRRSTAARDSFEPGEILTGPRGTRAKRAIIEESESEEEDEEEEDEDEEDEEVTDAESEEESDPVDADHDVEMDEAPPVAIANPVIAGTEAHARPTVTVTPVKAKPRKSRDKEIDVDDDEDDEELSVLESDEQNAGEKDEAGEELENEDEGPDQVDEEEEDDSEDDGLSQGIGSRASTPDMSKMTKRQRSRWEAAMGGDLLQLPSEPKMKKILSAEEHAMRRAEMARRRKNLSEKRNEEEKMDTINKLLKKQAPKQRRNRPTEGTGDATPSNLEAEPEKPRATMIRWISNFKGNRVGVPTEWLGTPAGRVFDVIQVSEQVVKEVEVSEKAIGEVGVEG